MACFFRTSCETFLLERILHVFYCFVLIKDKRRRKWGIGRSITTFQLVFISQVKGRSLSKCKKAEVGKLVGARFTQDGDYYRLVHLRLDLSTNEIKQTFQGSD